MYRIFLLSLFMICHAITAKSQATVGLQLHHKGSLDSGYVLFSPIGNNTTYLIDKCGRKVHSWTSNYPPGLSAVLMPDGSLLRTGMVQDMNPFATGGGVGGIIEKFDWDGHLVWSYKLCDSTECLHHDIELLPNGNILALVWEIKSLAEARNSGRRSINEPFNIWSEKVVELKPSGTNDATVVWEWHVWDHLVQYSNSGLKNYDSIPLHPEKLDINYNLTPQSDWLHFNTVKYNPDLNQILLSNHNWSEIYVIDHSTTTAQAASHTGGKSNKGGDILYRWGNPAVYHKGKPSDQKLFLQHDPNWIPKGFPNAGQIILFNNGLGRPTGNYSTVDIINPPVNLSGVYSTKTMPFLPANAGWTYTAVPKSTDFYSTFLSSAQMLSNGNIMICSGDNGVFFEINPSKEKVWEYIDPVNNFGPVTQGDKSGFSVFRCIFYQNTFSGFSGKNMAPGEQLELKPLAYPCGADTDFNHPVHVHTSGVSSSGISGVQFRVSNPVQDNITILAEGLNENIAIELVDIMGRTLQTWNTATFNDGSRFLLNLNSDIRAGMYFLKISGKNISYSTRILKN